MSQVKKERKKKRFCFHHRRTCHVGMCSSSTDRIAQVSQLLVLAAGVYTVAVAELPLYI